MVADSCSRACRWDFSSQGEVRESWAEVDSVVITRISIRGAPKWNGKLVKEKCSKSQREGVPCLCDWGPVGGKKELPGTSVWLF